MYYGQRNRPQGQGFYNPYMKSPDWGAGIRDMMNNFMVMKQYRDQMKQREQTSEMRQKQYDLQVQGQQATTDWRQHQIGQDEEQARLKGQEFAMARAKEAEARRKEKEPLYSKNFIGDVEFEFGLEPGAFASMPREGRKALGDEYLRRGGKQTPEEKLTYDIKLAEAKAGIVSKDSLQKGYGSQINRSITDFDGLIRRLSDPTKDLDSKQLALMSFLDVKSGEMEIFKNLEDRTKDKARAGVLKKMRNELQNLSNLATEKNLKTPQWERAKEITGGFYEIDEQGNAKISINDLDPGEDYYEDENGVKFVKRNGKKIQIIE